MPVAPKLNSTILTSSEGNDVLSSSVESGYLNSSSLKAEPSSMPWDDSSNDYLQLQFQIYRLTLIMAIFAVLITAIFFDFRTSISVLTGSFAGIFYLRLLARGIGKLGKSSVSVSKVQLLVPVLLFFLASKFSLLEILPALLGFFIYKPALIAQFLLKR